MRNRFLYKVKNNKELSEKLIFWAKKFMHSCFLYSNSPIKNDSFDKLKVFHNSYKDWMFGHFSYDLKNEIDKLTSENIDNLNFPNLFFFIPKIVFIMKEEALYVDTFSDKKETDIIIKEIIQIKLTFNIIIGYNKLLIFLEDLWKLTLTI